MSENNINNRNSEKSEKKGRKITPGRVVLVTGKGIITALDTVRVLLDVLEETTLTISTIDS